MDVFRKRSVVFGGVLIGLGFLVSPLAVRPGYAAVYEETAPAPSASALIVKLKTLDDERQEFADTIGALVMTGRDGFEAVLAELKATNDTKMRVALTYVLVELVRPMKEAAAPAVETLMAIAGNPKEEQLARLNAMGALAGIGPAAASAVDLLKGLVEQKGNADLRQNAAFALGGIGPAAIPAIETLVNYLKEVDDENLGAGLAVMIQKIGGNRIQPLLTEALQTAGSDNAQLSLVWVLGSEKALPDETMKVLAGLMKTTKNDKLRQMIRRAAENLENPSAELKEALQAR